MLTMLCCSSSQRCRTWRSSRPSLQFLVRRRACTRTSTNVRSRRSATKRMT
uniref:Uncharacterized protein n=1 Tax=Arundo donax TaxID=35708 RepID=A0A0A9HNS2_ARUDO